MSVHFTRTLWRSSCWVLIPLLATAALLFLLELARVATFLHRIHPWVAYAYMAGLGFLTVYFLLLLLGARHDASLLDAPLMPQDGARSHDELSLCARFLSARLKRMAPHPGIEPSERQRAREAATAIDDMLGHHPLNDDLVRVVRRCTEETLPVLHRAFRVAAQEHARMGMRQAAEDALSPAPSSEGARLVLRVRLMAHVIDSYMDRPSILEYLRVMADVAGVLQRAALIPQGRRFAEAVLANAPPLGPLSIAFTQSIHEIWTTRLIIQATILRCEDLRLRSLDRLASDLRNAAGDMIGDIRTCLVQEGGTNLKLLLRHYAPAGVGDPAAQAATTMDALTRALDAAAHSFRVRVASPAPVDHAHAAGNDEMIEDPARDSDARRPHVRRRRGSGGIGRIFFVVSQRLKYTMRRRD